MTTMSTIRIEKKFKSAPARSMSFVETRPEANMTALGPDATGSMNPNDAENAIGRSNN